MNSLLIASHTGCDASTNDLGIDGVQDRLHSYEDLALLMRDTLGRLFPLEGPFSSLADCRAVLNAVNNGFRALNDQGRREAKASLQALHEELTRSDLNGSGFQDIHADLNDTIRRCAPPLSTLNLNLVHQITGYLTEADLREASAVNRKFRKATEDRWLALKIKKPVCGVRGQDEAMPAFQEFLAQIKKLDGHMRGDPLIALSKSLCRLFDFNDRAKVLDQLLDLVEAMPDRFQSTPLAALPECFWTLLTEHRHSRFDAILNLAKNLPRDELEPVFAELVMALNSLEAASVVSRFHALLGLANEVPLTRRSGYLVYLAEQLHTIPDTDLMASFDLILQMNQVVPADEQGAALVALAWKCNDLPEEVRQKGFDAVLERVRSLPDAQRAQPLLVLVGRLHTLPDRGVMARDAIRDVADLLPPEQKMRVQERLDSWGL